MALQAEQVAAETGAFQERPLWKHHKLFFGVAAQFCYVGAQVAGIFIHISSPPNYSAKSLTYKSRIPIHQLYPRGGRSDPSTSQQSLRHRSVLFRSREIRRGRHVLVLEASTDSDGFHDRSAFLLHPLSMKANSRRGHDFHNLFDRCPWRGWRSTTDCRVVFRGKITLKSEAKQRQLIDCKLI